MADPTFAQLGRQAELDAVHAELDYATQAAGLKVHSGDSYDDAQQFRRDTIRRLQLALPPAVNANIRGKMSDSLYAGAPEVVARIEGHVLRETIKAAHESPELRPVVTRDVTGRETVEFFGGRLGWMSQFKEQPLLMVGLGGQPYGD